MNITYLFDGVRQEFGNRIRKVITRDNYAHAWVASHVDSQMQKNLHKESFLSLPSIDENNLSIMKNEVDIILRGVGNGNSESVYRHIVHSKYFDPKMMLISLTLREDILSLVANYFGTRPYLHGLRLLVSEPKENNCVSRDQLWHRDKYDDKTIRLFLYIDECRENMGPFMYCPLEYSKKNFRTFISRVNDDYMNRNNLREKCVSVTGNSGALFLADVRKLVHCGSRIRKGRRLVFNAIYTSGNPWMQRTLDRNLISALRDGDLTDLQQAALAD